MQPSDRGNAADYADREAAEMGRILVLGAAVGVPLVFAITLLLVLAAGARGAGSSGPGGGAAAGRGWTAGTPT